VARTVGPCDKCLAGRDIDVDEADAPCATNASTSDAPMPAAPTVIHTARFCKLG